MIFQDISRNFDMLNSKICKRVFMIIKLLETKNEPILRVSRFLEPCGLIQPVLDPLTCVNCLPAVYGSATRSRVDGKHDIVDTQRWCATATEYDKGGLRGAEPPLGVRTKHLHSFPAQSLNLQIQKLKN